METAKRYVELIAHLKGRYLANPKHKTRLLGLVFCRPDKALAKQEILPSLPYYHRRSGKNVDFYFAGFDDKLVSERAGDAILSGNPSKPVWNFDLELFE